MINDPPKYRYPLFEKWDQETFKLIKSMAKIKKYPRMLGNKEDKNEFLNRLIRCQNTDNWRKPLLGIVDSIKRTGIINTAHLNKISSKKTDKTSYSWVTYKEDEIVANFLNELETKKLTFEGSDREMTEFVLRFILGQLGNDWESTIFMIWELLGNKNKLSLKELNQEMRNFDYCKLFD